MNTNNRSLLIDPPQILGFLDDQEIANRIVLLDLGARDVENDQVRFDLNVVFKPIPIRRGSISKSDFYFGTTGAEITFCANTGEVTDYTPPVKLNVEYEIGKSISKESNLSIDPGFAISSLSKRFEAATGEASLKKLNEDSVSYRFTLEERLLETTTLGNRIQWHLVHPMRKGPLTEFLRGNLYLFAICKWNESVSGEVKVRPSDLLFFDSKRKAIRGVRSILMRFALWKKGITFGVQEMIEIIFEEEIKPRK